MWLEDLERLCGRGLLFASQDVEKGRDDDGEGTEGVETQNDDRARLETEREDVRVLEDGEDADATPLAQPLAV